MSGETISREVLLGWFVGLFDGEGSIGFVLRDRRYQLPRITLAIESEAGAMRCKKFLVEFNLPYWQGKQKPRKNMKATMYDFHFFGYRTIKKLLDVITPYLIIKQEQAEIVKGFVEYRISLGNENDIRTLSEEEKARLIGVRTLAIQRLDELNKKGIRVRKWPDGTLTRRAQPSTTTEVDSPSSVGEMV